MQTGLAQKSVVVTGGNANIGRAIVLAFAAEQAKVAVVARDEKAGAAVVQDALAAGAADAFFVATDVTDRAQVTAMVADVSSRFGGVDVLVNNVGGNVAYSDFVDSDPDTWAADIDLTFTSVLNVTHAVLPGMIERSFGRIVNIGSLAGVTGDPMLAIYSAQKGAVHSFTTVLAREVGPRGVRVNAVAPYGTMPADLNAHTSSGSRWRPDGPLFTAVRELGEKFQIGRKTILDRLAKPEEVAAAVVFLASDPAEYITGEILHVDGGARWA
jgi:2-hydroxycyclohexanecarboxyl-CoA dehydrogenase